MPDYRMRAWQTVQEVFVFWNVLNAPDFTGDQSGQPVEELSSICVVEVLPEPFTPKRMLTDSNTYLYWDFQETTAPFADQGSANIPMQDVVGDGVGYQAGVRGPIFWGKGVSFGEDLEDAGIRADGTTAFPGSQLNVAVWFTLQDYTQLNDEGRIFAKAWQPTSWTPNYFSFSIAYSLTELLLFYRPGGGTGTQVSVPRDLWTLLYQPHFVGFSHDGTTYKLYVDGIEAASGSEATSPASNLGTGPWFVGNYPDAGSSPLGGTGGAQRIAGIVEEVRVCRVARDADWWLDNWEYGRGLK